MASSPPYFSPGQVLSADDLNTVFAEMQAISTSAIAQMNVIVAAGVTAIGESATFTQTTTLTVSETIQAGAFVNIWNNAGVASIRNAIATSSDKFACGFAASALTSGNPGTAILTGLNSAIVTTPPYGQVWLSDVTPGGIITSSLDPNDPANTGKISQHLGAQIPGVGVFFFPSGSVLL